MGEDQDKYKGTDVQIRVIEAEHTRLRLELDSLKTQFVDLKTTVVVLANDLKNIEKTISSINQNLTESFKSISETIEDFKKEFMEKYVTNEKFEPVKLIVYGLAAGVFMTVLGAVLGKVIL
jgi:chromosome segregation ATPase